MIEGAVSLVTGGASGLGKATVERLVKYGSKVVIFDVPNSKGAEVASALGENKVIFVPGTVTSECDVQTALSVAKEKFGRLDNVINCAGIVGLQKCVYDFPEKTVYPLEEFTKILSVNTIGTFNVTRLAVGLIGENEPDEHGCRGVVVNIASIIGFDGQMCLAAYAASKGAVIAMTLPLARDLSSQGIRVMTIAPGLFETPILRDVPEEAMQDLIHNIPFPKRPGRPEEFAQLVQDIIENPMLNGEVIRLDAGMRSSF